MEKFNFGGVSMVKSTTDGKCLFCNKTLGKRALKTHLNKCKVKQEVDSKNNEKNSAEKTFLILAEGKYAIDFWMYFEANEKIPLSKVDDFLRQVWLECCGHLSAFHVGRSEISMSKKLNSFLKEGSELDYQYDFGSTTDLKFKVISERIGSLGKAKIRIDAINNLPEIKCSFCKKDAKFICPFCFEEEMCDKHVSKHSCAQEEGEEAMLPVVNSPRMGVCGYCGPDEGVVESYYPQK